MNLINVFSDNISIDTQTIYAENGKININRCPYEDNPHLVLFGDRVSQKGRMVTEDDGTSVFRPYAKDSGSRYNVLLQTTYGLVKETKNHVIFQLRFPKNLGKALVRSLFKEEMIKLAAFIKSRSTKTMWR